MNWLFSKVSVVKAYMLSLAVLASLISYDFIYDLTKIEEVVSQNHGAEVKKFLEDALIEVQEINEITCEEYQCASALSILGNLGYRAPDHTVLYVVRTPTDSRFGNVVTGNLPSSIFSTNQAAFFEYGIALKLQQNSIWGESVLAYAPIAYSDDRKYRFFLVAETSSQTLASKSAESERQITMYFLINLVVVFTVTSIIYSILFTIEQILKFKEGSKE